MTDETVKQSATINLTKGRVVLVDAADYDELSQYSWHYCAGYAARRISTKAILYMHRFLASAKPGQYVDHINRNKLDNRRQNLRICSQADNLANQYRPFGSSQYKGVSWDKTRNLWKAQIQRQGRNRFIGRYKTELEAAAAYDAQAARLFKQFAVLNTKETL